MMLQATSQAHVSVLIIWASAFHLSSLSSTVSLTSSLVASTEPVPVHVSQENPMTVSSSSVLPISTESSLELIATHMNDAELNFPASTLSPATEAGPLLACNRIDRGSNQHSKKKALIACLLPFDQERLFSLQRVRPAFDVALQKIATLGLLPEHELHVSYRDSKCSISDGMNEAVNFYATNTADVFFGPTCDYAAAPVARQVRYWGKALVTPGAMAGDFGLNKTDMFPMLTRVGTNFNSLVVFIRALMDHFGWRRLKLIYNPDGLREIMDRYCHIAMDAIHHGLRLARALGKEDIQHDHYKFYLAQNMAEDLPLEVGSQFSGLWPIVRLLAAADDELVFHDFTPREAARQTTACLTCKAR